MRDHTHVTGWFIAAAHQQCNLQRSVNYQIPVFFHNFSGYDSYLIVHEFPNSQDRKLKVIGQNMEKYLQVQWGPNIVFCDSLQFLTSFLDSLVKSLAKTGQQNFFLLYDTMRNFYADATDEMVQLVEQKGVFCYDYIDKLEDLMKPRSRHASNSTIGWPVRTALKQIMRAPDECGGTLSSSISAITCDFIS